ncbi:hypothetical protein D030_4403B, partial [Vibrio parahaemolyticus AQ3810]
GVAAGPHRFARPTLLLTEARSLVLESLNLRSRKG